MGCYEGCVRGEVRVGVGQLLGWVCVSLVPGGGVLEVCHWHIGFFLLAWIGSSGHGCFFVAILYN